MRVMNQINTLYVVFICFYLLMCCWSSEEIDNDVIDVDNSIRFGQKVDEEAVIKVNVETEKKQPKKKFNVSEYRVLLSKLPDGRPYGVYDNIIKAKSQILLKTYLTYNTDAWLFNNYDQDDENKQKTHDNVPWINEKDPFEFSRSRLCTRLIAAVRDVSKDAQSYYPYRVFGKILRRGDHTLVSEDSNETGDFTALVFVNEFWRKNYYGELYLYDKKREIVGGATHEAGRVAIYESTILHLNRPPAVQFLQGQVLFQVQFSKKQARMEEGHQKWLSYVQARADAKEKWFIADYKLPNGDPFTPPDPEKHKTFEYTTKTDGRKIFVYDNLFPVDLLDHLRGFVLKYGTYFYDDSIDKHSDNVQWIAGFLLKSYIKSPYWKVVQKVAKHATGSDSMFPYDVSINLVRNSDHTRIHGDVSYYGEEEFTCLVYLNPNWKNNYYGETTFFEKNSDDTEIVAQVRPRYGRTVIFDGNIPHSARPPSFNFTGARLTFVTKLHRNEYTGRKKNFQEEHRQLTSAIHGLEQVAMFSSKQGENYAKRYLNDIRKIKASFDSHPDGNEQHQDGMASSGEKDDDDVIDDSQADSEGTNDVADKNDGEDLGEAPLGEAPFFDEEADDEYTRELNTHLEDVTENSVDGVNKIIAAHDKMNEMKETLTRELGESIIKVL